MTDIAVHGTETENFDDLFNLDTRIEALGRPLGRCNSTDDGCSNSCTSVGCTRGCNHP